MKLAVHLRRYPPGNIILPAEAAEEVTRILGCLPWPFTAAEAGRALQTTRRVVILLLEWLDRQGITPAAG